MKVARPNIERHKLESLLKTHGVDLSTEKVVLIGIRGLMAKGKNQVGVWDDGLIWITPETCDQFGGNTDPSRERQLMANLKVGKWRYKTGMHNGATLPPYEAFRQAAPVTVLRWDEKLGKPAIEDTGMFGINIHHGGTGTSSLGCQTIPMEQWQEFKNLGYKLLAKYAKKDFIYLLVDSL